MRRARRVDAPGARVGCGGHAGRRAGRRAAKRVEATGARVESEGNGRGRGGGGKGWPHGLQLLIGAALAAGLLVPRGAEAQQERTPALAWDVAVGAADGRWVLATEVPEGWRLYAAEPGAAGLPLVVRPAGATVTAAEAPFRVRWNAPREVPTPAGPVRVHEGRLRGLLELGRQPRPAPSPPDSVEVRWALCRADRCVPGSARLELPR